MKPANPKSPPRSSPKSAGTISHRQCPPHEGGTPSAQHSPIILLAVTGMSPAVLTETVWALAHEKPATIPHRVIVITTTQGKATIERELFEPSKEFSGQCVWDCLRHCLSRGGHDVVDRLRYEDRVFKIWNPKSARYELLQDIRTKAENAAAADFLIEQVRAVAEIPDACLIASIAGGRKTMGALLYACMSLLGRETDRLTHVLIRDPFETGVSPQFYFNHQPAQKLTTRDGKSVQAKDAQIDLADMPLVPLRNLFERDLVKKPSTFIGLVERCQHAVAEMVRRDLRLTVRRTRPEIQINSSKPVRLSNLQHLLMLFLAENAAAGRPPLGKYLDALRPLKDFTDRLYAERDRSDFSDWRHNARLPADFDSAIKNHDDLKLRKLRDELKNKLRGSGTEAARLVPLLPVKGRFSVDLPASAILLRD